MYTSPQYIPIGQILKPTGTQGEIKIDIGEDFWEDIESKNHIFLKLRGSFVPFFIEYVRDTHQSLILKLEEVNAPEDALKFNLKEIYLRENEIISDAYFNKKTKQDLEDYMVYNNEQKVGTIIEIQEHPQQLIAIVNYENKNVMIPLVDEWILKIDDGQKSIHMLFPIELLDIN